MRRVIDILSIAAIVAAVVLFVTLASHKVQAFDPLPRPWQGEEHTTEAPAPKEPFARFPLNEPRVVTMEANEQVFGRLSDREQRDQILDWLLFTVAYDTGLSLEEINQILFDVPPVRYGYMHPVAGFEYGDTRSVYIGQGQVIALLPTHQLEERVDHLAQIADRHRKNTGQIPETVLVFEYTITPEQATGMLTRREPLDGRDLFTAAYGYHEAEIVNLVDLETFMAQIDDVTFARATAGGLTLGGRRVRGGDYLGVTVEDVAAIWQAHNEILDDLRAFESRWEQRIEALEFKWSLETYKTELERLTLERQMEEEVEQLMQERAQEQMEIGLVNGTGFSLDPVYDFEGLTEFFEAIRSDLEETATVVGAPITLVDIQEVDRGLAIQDEVPLLVLNRKLKDSPDSDLATLGEILDLFVRGNYQYQAARYDGNLQGSEVGMTLFYTDLMAKLWGFDYHDSAPEHIEGFVADPSRQISPVYRQEIIELPNTRLWFGHRHDGFQTADDGDDLLFARVATRVYAASSNPLEPGVEVEANFPSALFLGWWNDHYSTVARFEPQYQRLNEIMKWSLLVSWLGEAEREDLLGFLAKVDVDRTNWFPDWAQARSDLQYQEWDAIEFHPRGYLGTETEAIPILFSDSYALFIDDVEAAWYLSGGVSLADVNLFDDIVPLSSQVDDLLLRSTIDYSYLDDVFTLQTLDDIQYTFTGLGDDLIAVTSLAKGENVRLRSLDAEVANQPIQRVVNQGRLGSALEFEVRAGDAGLGALEIVPTENGFAVGWLSRDIDAGHQLALGMSVSKDQPIASTLLKSGDVQAVVDLADDGFLAQMKGSSGWLHFAEESAPSARVPSGWRSRVADPQVGVRGILLNWGEDAAAPLARGGYLHTDPVEPTLFRFVGDDLPAGLRTVEIQGSGHAYPIRLDPESGEVYFRIQDLPEQDLSLLQDVTRPADVARMRGLISEAPDELVRYVPESLTLEHHSMGQALGGDDFDTLAQMIVADPRRFQQTLDGYLEVSLNQVDDLLTSGKSADALDILDDLTGFYGPRSDLNLRRGLALLDDGQLELAARVSNESAGGPLQSAQPFFDEINGRLSVGGLSQAEQQNLHHFAEFVDWRNLQAQGLGPEGEIMLTADEGVFSLEYHLPGSLAGEPVPLNALEKGGVFYVQDSPTLNNLDWSPGAFHSSLDEAVSGDLGRVIRLPQGDIAYYRPGHIYDAVGEKFALVSQPTMPIPKGYIFHVGSVFDPCGDDDVCEEREQATCIVVEQ